MWVRVFVLLYFKCSIFFFQFDGNQYIKRLLRSLSIFIVLILHVHACKVCDLIYILSLLVHDRHILTFFVLYEYTRHIVLNRSFKIVCTEGFRNMYNTSSVFSSYKVTDHYGKRWLFQWNVWHQLLIIHAFHVSSFKGIDHLERD